MTPEAQRDLIERLVARTTVWIRTEYPNTMRLSLFEAPTTPVTPRHLHPAFFGCYDWHSAVHSHWQLVRAMRWFPDAPFVTDATAAIGETLTTAAVAAEMRWLEPRPDFEMPYGMAWVLALCDELRRWNAPVARICSEALAPMEEHAVTRFGAYCARMVTPVRGGMHNQSAFSLGLVWDHAVSTGTTGLRSALADVARRFFLGDIGVDLRHEPSAADFLSPSLAAADLLRRVLEPEEFATWFDRFAPDGFDLLDPVAVVDASDGQLAHWAGLNLSRSWMMSSLADALPDDHRHVPALRASADRHAEVGLAWCDHDDDMISHWVPTFAVYQLTEGSSPPPGSDDAAPTTV